MMREGKIRELNPIEGKKKKRKKNEKWMRRNLEGRGQMNNF